MFSVVFVVLKVSTAINISLNANVSFIRCNFQFNCKVMPSRETGQVIKLYLEQLLFVEPDKMSFLSCTSAEILAFDFRVKTVWLGGWLVTK